MKIHKRLILTLIILVLLFSGLLGLRYLWLSYACIYSTNKIYPYSGSKYYAEIKEEACSGFGATNTINIQLIQTGVFFNTEKTILSFDASNIKSLPQLHWVKADELEIIMTSALQDVSASPVMDVDGIRILYVTK